MKAPCYRLTQLRSLARMPSPVMSVEGEALVDVGQRVDMMNILVEGGCKFSMTRLRLRLRLRKKEDTVSVEWGL